MSADRDALFARIMEDPDDDAPRLIYSDILEEEGDADRAEFIRLQIRFARMAADDPARKAVNDRVRDLELEFGVKWLSEMPYTPGVHWEIFERGFISTARFDNPDRFFEHAPAVFASTPISRLRLHQFFSDDVRRLAPLPLLNQVKELDLEDGCRAGNAGVNALFDQGQLKAVHTLRLMGNNLGPAAMGIIATSPVAPQLRLLDVSRNDIHDDGAAALGGTEWHGGLANLRQLSLGDCRLTRSGVNELFRRRSFGTLHVLHLSGNDLSGGGFLRIRSLADFRQLAAALLANRCGLPDDDFIAFLNWIEMPELRWLYLRQNNLTDASASRLAVADDFFNLRDLNLGENRITRLHLPALQAKYGPGVIVD